jgi:polyhydroxyalkanoate synthesis regulator phasin
MRIGRWPLALAAGTVTTALAGGIALAGIQPFGGPDPLEQISAGDVTGLAERDLPKDRLKAILDGLVAKGTLTQAQADAVLAALHDAQPTHPPKPALPPHPLAFLGDLMKATSGYLGLDTKTLLGQLHGGKSVADIANGLGAQGKSAQGLIDLLTRTANARVDQAVAQGKLTVEQAAALRPRIATEIDTYVHRSFPAPVLPRKPATPTPTTRS